MYLNMLLLFVLSYFLYFCGVVRDNHLRICLSSIEWLAEVNTCIHLYIVNTHSYQFSGTYCTLRFFVSQLTCAAVILKTPYNARQIVRMLNECPVACDRYRVGHEWVYTPAAGDYSFGVLLIVVAMDRSV